MKSKLGGQIANRQTGTPRSERLFAQLDDRTVRVFGQVWHLEVYGICEEHGRRWVQLAIDGPQHYMLTVALATRATVDRALRSLASWLANPSDTQHVLHVS